MLHDYIVHIGSLSANITIHNYSDIFTIKCIYFQFYFIHPSHII